jgi:hypothetical protein
MRTRQNVTLYVYFIPGLFLTFVLGYYNLSRHSTWYDRLTSCQINCNVSDGFIRKTRKTCSAYTIITASARRDAWESGNVPNGHIYHSLSLCLLKLFSCATDVEIQAVFCIRKLWGSHLDWDTAWSRGVPELPLAHFKIQFVMVSQLHSSTLWLMNHSTIQHLGSRWHCATSRNVTGSIPYGVTGDF